MASVSLTWAELLSCLGDAVKSSKTAKAEKVIQLFSSYKSNEEDWSRHAYLKESGVYTRNLVDAGNVRYNLMILVWNPGKGSCIHDHAGSNCILKVLNGVIDEIRYQTPEEGKDLKVIGEYQYQRDEVAFIEDTIGVHEMKNTTNGPVVTLHLYSPPFEVCHAYNRQTATRKPCLMEYNTICGEVIREEASTDDDEEAQSCP